MIRLLIVDDEPIERIALQKMIETGFSDVQVIGHASNGREAIEAAKLHKPDLITMDIKMPGINGLEAIEQIKALNDGIKFIMVTAFDTFDFARQALRLGVSDYLLKPSRASVVLETIGKVVDEIKQSRLEMERREMDRERLRRMIPIVETDIISQLLFENGPSIHLNEMIDLLGPPSEKGGFVMNLLFTPSMDKEEQAGELEELYAMIKQLCDTGSIPCWIGKISGKQIPIIVFMEGELSYRNHGVSLGRKFVQALQRKSSYEPFIGIGGLCKDIREIRKSYHEALLASMDLSLPSKFCLFEDLSQLEHPLVGSKVLELEKSVLEEVRRGNWTSAGDQLDRLIDLYEGAGHKTGITQQRIFEVVILVSRMLQEMGIEVNKPFYPYLVGNFMQLKSETRLLLRHLAESTELSAGELESDLISIMKRFIKEHAHEDLSLERIAAKVNRNPFYVSKIFKEQIGTNYIDYLTDCRMETAKQLMQDPEKSLKEITFEIGYHDPNYFSRVFKKLVGQSPTDYRKALLRPASRAHN